jgi:hypothetical protein
MTIHQAIKHSRPSRLSNRRRDFADCIVIMIVDIHTLMVSEVLMSINWHTFECAHD